MLLNESQSGATVTVVRKRRSRRHHRNRRIRRALLIFICVAFIFTLSSVILRHLSPSLFHDASRGVPDRKTAEASRSLVLTSQQKAAGQIKGRSVYKYSVVPGGVRSVQELKWAAEHDPIVAAHYAGFDYDHARVVKLILARTAYVSYRIGDKVYWTRHRVSLKKGETVITDGKMMARARCANRIEEMPQQATSESEPPPANFDEPIQPAPGLAVVAPPVPFESALMNRDAIPGLGPAAPPNAYDPIVNQPLTPILPPPLPGVCGIGIGNKNPKGSAGIGTIPLSSDGKNRKKFDPCDSGGGGGELPEPGTWLLMGSGIAGLCWKARHRFSRSTGLSQ